MRLEYNFSLDDVDVPRFAVEAEGIGKLFTLATLLLNVFSVKKRVEIVFHGLNPEEPARKIEAFRQILETASESGAFRLENGLGGRIPGTSSHFQWLRVEREGA